MADDFEGVQWELIPSTDISREYGRFVAAPSGGNFGAVTRYAQVPPVVSVQLEGKNVPAKYIQPLRNKVLRMGTASFALTQPDPTTGGGRTLTGVITGYSDRCQDGTWDYTVRISVERTDLNVAQSDIVDTTPPGGLKL